MKRQYLLGILTLMISFSVNAEYRVYQYLIKSKFPKPQDQKSYIVTSTLHPRGYETYHGGSEALKIDLLRSWTCRGYTGNKRPICPSPTSAIQPEEEVKEKK